MSTKDEAVKLRDKGWTIKGIADHLGKSKSTISAALKRARNEQGRGGSTNEGEQPNEGANSEANEGERPGEPFDEPVANSDEVAADPGDDSGPVYRVALRHRHAIWLRRVAEAEGRDPEEIIRMLVARAYASDPYRHGSTGGTIPGKEAPA